MYQQFYRNARRAVALGFVMAIASGQFWVLYALLGKPCPAIVEQLSLGGLTLAALSGLAMLGATVLAALYSGNALPK